MNDIFTRLMNGESEEDIVKAFTEELNAAKRKQETQSHKYDDFAYLMEHIHDFLMDHYPDVFGDDTDELTEEEIKAMYETADTFLSNLKISTYTSKDVDKDTFNRFMKSMAKLYNWF